VVSAAHVPAALGRLPSGYSFGGLIVLFIAMGVLVPVSWRVHISAEIASLLYYVTLNRGILNTRSEGGAMVVDAAYLFWVILSINVSVAMFERLMESQAQAKLELQHLAAVDGLTGVYGRRHLMSLARREFERARRYGTKLCAVMIDVDRFKQINEDHGHLVGDRVLAETAQRLRQALREVDVFGRYGGEEFVALLPEADLDTATNVIAERLRAVVRERRFVVDDVAVEVSVSLGVAELRDGIDDLDVLLGEADAALFAAKRAGRDRVVASLPPRDDRVRRAVGSSRP
jgi:diguanylate cyclase (GGDEF)-like protein